MIKGAENGGLYFRLEKHEWKGDTGSFFAALHKLPTAVYEPVELDDYEHIWFIGKDSIAGFNTIYKKYILDVLEFIEADKAAGFEPLKRAGGRFANRKSGV